MFSRVVSANVCCLSSEVTSTTKINTKSSEEFKIKKPVGMVNGKGVQEKWTQYVGP